MIVFNDVTKNYGTNVGLTGASVHINSGDFVFLVGPSGAGKTTFIRLILKEIEPDSGKITVAGKDITHLSRREIPKLRQKIGMVFQDFRLLEKKTVYENVAFAMEVVHKSKKEIQERVPYVLKLVDIEDKANRYPNELSAGEQQRVGIARALANKPRIMICDEPTGNLDPVTAMDIMNLLERINRNGTTILMVTHAKDIVDKMNKRVVAIENGHIVRDEQGRYGYKSENDDNDDPSAEPEHFGKPGTINATYKSSGFNYDTGMYDLPLSDLPDDSVFGNSLREDDSVFAHSYAEGDDVFGVKPLFEEETKASRKTYAVSGSDIKSMSKEELAEQLNKEFAIKTETVKEEVKEEFHEEAQEELVIEAKEEDMGDTMALISSYLDEEE